MCLAYAHLPSGNDRRVIHMTLVSNEAGPDIGGAKINRKKFVFTVTIHKC